MNRGLRAKVWLGRVAANAGRHARGHRRLVLLYHAIGDSQFAVREDVFRRQMAHLATHWRVVSLEALIDHRDDEPAAPLCAITFDDGYLSVYEHAYPILEEHGLAATVYVTTNALGTNGTPVRAVEPGLYPDERMLSWDQIAEMSRRGITIGSHLCHHRDLTTLASREALGELAGSKRFIEDRLGRPCPDLAYPWGRCNDQVVVWTAASGYARAVTGIHGPVRARGNALRIPRIDIRREYEMAHFEAILRGDWDYLGTVQRLRMYARR